MNWKFDLKTLLCFKIVFPFLRELSKRNVEVLIDQCLHFIRAECIADTKSTTSTPSFIQPYITWTWDFWRCLLVTFTLPCMVVSIITFFMPLVFCWYKMLSSFVFHQFALIDIIEHKKLSYQILCNYQTLICPCYIVFCSFANQLIGLTNIWENEISVWYLCVA